MSRNVLKSLIAGAIAIVAAGGIARAETVVSATQTSYDYLGHPVCVAQRMNPAVYGALPSDPCSLGTSGSYGLDRITHNTYDAAGQLTQVDQAYGVSGTQRIYARYTYTNDGLKQTETDANNNKTMYVYDGVNRLSQVQYPSTTAGSGGINTADYEQFGYDADDNKTSWRRRNGKTFSYVYDNLNRETEHYISDGSVQSVWSGYDGLGRLSWARFGSTGGSGIGNSYDGLGRLVSQTDANGKSVSYAYNQASARTALTYPDGHYVGSTVDAANRMTGMGMDAYTGLIGQSYDDLGSRTWLGRGLSVGGYYSHDNLGRLTSMTNDVVVGTSADITWSFSYNPANQLVTTSASSTFYDYKESNNTADSHTFNGLNQDAAIAAIGGGYDANGNLGNDGSRLFYYDSYNRLTGIGSSAYPANPPYMTFSYDPLGRLSSQTWYGSTTTNFVYDGTDLIAEYDGAGTLLERYVHGTGTDEPLAWYHGADLSTLRFFFQDYHGSVIGYVDASGNLGDYYKYDPYGVPYQSTNTTPWTGSARFGYTGQMVLPEVKLDYYRARIYDPVMGRFLQTDPIGSGDDLDLYAYVAGDPIDRADPTGMISSGDDPVKKFLDNLAKSLTTQAAKTREALRRIKVPTSTSRKDVKDQNGQSVPVSKRQQTTTASDGRTMIVTTPHDKDDPDENGEIEHPEDHVHAAPVKVVLPNGKPGQTEGFPGYVPYKNGGAAYPPKPDQPVKVDPTVAKQNFVSAVLTEAIVEGEEDEEGE